MCSTHNTWQHLAAVMCQQEGLPGPCQQWSVCKTHGTLQQVVLSSLPPCAP